MKCSAVGLILNAARALKRKDPGAAYALAELAENMRLLMRGEASMEDWRKVYVGADDEPIDPEKIVPVV